MTDLVRLSKLMSQRGLSSRREADRLIERGLVLVDGKAIDTLGTKVAPDAKIELKPEGQALQNELVTIMINKPVGYVSGQAEDDYVPAVRLIKADTHSDTDQTGMVLKGQHFDGLAPAGRLDIDSQGLLVLTQDGRIAKQLIGEHSDIEKEYLVRVDEQITDQQIDQLSFGLSLDGKPLKPAKIRQLNNEQLQFILREGKKRQIRRMCDAVGLHVTGLKRVRVGELRLGKLAEGEWRFVKADEFRHGSTRRSSPDKPRPRRSRQKSLYGKGSTHRS